MVPEKLRAVLFSGGDIAADLFEFSYQVRMMVEKVFTDGVVS